MTTNTGNIRAQLSLQIRKLRYCGRCSEYFIFLNSSGCSYFSRYNCMPEFKLPSTGDAVCRAKMKILHRTYYKIVFEDVAGYGFK